MKKVALFLGVAFLATAGLTSCKKDRTCVCSYTDDGVKMEEKFEYKDITKKDAQAACDVWDTQIKIIGGSCELE
jgi:hypothetical protein